MAEIKPGDLAIITGACCQQAEAYGIGRLITINSVFESDDWQCLSCGYACTRWVSWSDDTWPLHWVTRIDPQARSERGTASEAARA